MIERQRVIEFVRDDYPRVVAGLAFACGDVARAEDAVQGALASALESRGQIDNLTGWVMTTALNNARTGARRLGAERRAFERFARLRARPPVAAAPPLDDSVTDALRQLPARQREVVVLHYLLDMSVSEVAGALGVTDGTIKTQLHRARASLRERLPSQEETDYVG